MKKIIIILFTLIILSNLTYAGGELVDSQETQDTHQNLGYDSNWRCIATSFTASTTYTTDKISIYVKREGTMPDNYGLNVTLYDNTTGSVPGNMLADVTPLKANLIGTSFEWINFSLLETVALTSGVDYYVVGKTNFTDDTNHLPWGRTNTATGQQYYYKGCSIGWATIANKQMDFRIYNATQEADSCSCPESGDWHITGGDECELTTECNIGSNAFRVLDGKMRINSGGYIKAGGCYVEDGESLYIDDDGGLHCEG